MSNEGNDINRYDNYRSPNLFNHQNGQTEIILSKNRNFINRHTPPRNFYDNHVGGFKKDQPLEIIMVKMLVPAYAVGSIIGKQGQSITNLQKNTGIKINLSKSKDFYPGTTERIALIQGKSEGRNVYDVIKTIIQKIVEFPVPKEMLQLNAERAKQVKIIVPNSTAGLIIGKKGATIKHIMDTTLAKVQMTQKPDGNNMPSILERVITICGEPDQLFNAVDKILEKIKADPQSASCPNLSYQNVQGLIANANPVGSPYAPVSGNQVEYSIKGLNLANQGLLAYQRNPQNFVNLSSNNNQGNFSNFPITVNAGNFIPTAQPIQVNFVAPGSNSENNQNRSSQNNNNNNNNQNNGPANFTILQPNPMPSNFQIRNNLPNNMNLALSSATLLTNLSIQGTSNHNEQNDSNSNSKATETSSNNNQNPSNNNNNPNQINHQKPSNSSPSENFVSQTSTVSNPTQNQSHVNNHNSTTNNNNNTSTNQPSNHLQSTTTTNTNLHHNTVSHYFSAYPASFTTAGFNNNQTYLVPVNYSTNAINSSNLIARLGGPHGAIPFRTNSVNNSTAVSVSQRHHQSNNFHLSSQSNSSNNTNNNNRLNSSHHKNNAFTVTSVTAVETPKNPSQNNNSQQTATAVKSIQPENFVSSEITKNPNLNQSKSKTDTSVLDLVESVEKLN